MGGASEVGRATWREHLRWEGQHGGSIWGGKGNMGGASEVGRATWREHLRWEGQHGCEVTTAVLAFLSGK